MSSSCHYQLWMGSVEPYMTEEFIIGAFRKMGEEPERVRIIRNKYTGNLLGYCFINFTADDHATCALHNLNGKPIPGTNPVVRFRLNSARHALQMQGNERELSLWVGNLSSDVDDGQLYKIFTSKYNSVKQAKVIIDSSGNSKGYGFVRFALEEELKSALDRMNGYTGLGSKPLKVNNAVLKPKKEPGILGHSPNYGYESTNSTTNSSVYTQYQDSSSQWEAYNPWQTYDQGENSGQVYRNNYTSYKAYEEESQPWEGYCYPSANSSIENREAACYQQKIPTGQSIAGTQQSEMWADHSTEQHEEEAYYAAYDDYEDDYDENNSVDNLKIEMDIENKNCDDSIEILESSKWMPTE